MQLVFSLLAGLVITVALQLVLTSLGAAFGLSILDFAPQTSSSSVSSNTEHSQSNFPFPVTHLVGFGVALSLTAVLFCSSLAMTEFGQIDEPRRGLIFGVILWATYWLLLIWLSSTTVVSLADSMIGAVAAGSKRLISVLRGAIQGNDSQSSPQPDTLQILISEVSQIAQRQEQLPYLLAQQRKILLDEILDENISMAERLSDQAPKINSFSESSETVSNDFESTAPSTISRVAKKSMSALKTALSKTTSQFDFPSWKELLQKGMDQLDWSDWDLETLWYQLQSSTFEISLKPFQNAIIRDAEYYIRSAPVWSFRPPLLESEFYDRLCDPLAEPQAIEKQLRQLSRTHFLDWLKARNDLPLPEIDSLADKLIEIRDQVLHSLDSDHDSTVDREIFSEIQNKIINYCRYTNRDALTREGMINKVNSLMKTVQDQSLPPIDQALDLDAIQSVLINRQGISAKHWRSLIRSLESTWSEFRDENSSLEEVAAVDLPRPWAVRAMNSPQNLWHQLNEQLVHYFSYQDKKEFTPARIAEDMSKIIQTTLRSLPDFSELSQLSTMFDSETRAIWQQTLEQRRDMTLDEIDHILSWCDSAWKETLPKAEQILQSLFSTISDAISMPKVLDDPESFLDTVSQKFSEPLEIIQDKVEQQADRVTTDLQIQADMAKNQVQIAAWWLFISLLFSGVSAAIAGWVAVLY